MAKTDAKPSIVDWFDIRNVNHLRAWSELEKTGKWPEGFVPWDEVSIPNLWHYQILHKMADLYVLKTIAESYLASIP